MRTGKKKLLVEREKDKMWSSQKAEGVWLEKDSIYEYMHHFSNGSSSPLPLFLFLCLHLFLLHTIVRRLVTK